jgi:hypothetical protein
MDGTYPSLKSINGHACPGIFPPAKKDGGLDEILVPEIVHAAG